MNPLRPGTRPCPTWPRSGYSRRASGHRPFDLACRWRLVEEYGADRFTEESDGPAALFTGGFPDAGKRAQLGPDLWRQGGAAGAGGAAERLGVLSQTLADLYRGRELTWRLMRIS